MKIGILEVGEIPAELHEKHGDYPSMFARLIGSVDPDAEFAMYKVVREQYPNAPTDADGWIITGSRHGVYEGHPWIEPLKAFLRACVDQEVPVAGICFGHQILAEALGGRVEKSPKGWGLGVHNYSIDKQVPWMSDAGDTFASHALHQDQIIDLPPSSTVVASSDFCEYAALVYGDIEKPTAFSIQPHPEFSADFVDELIEQRTPSVFDATIAKTARGTLGQNVDNQKWAQWIYGFLALASRQRKNKLL